MADLLALHSEAHPGEPAALRLHLAARRLGGRLAVLLDALGTGGERVGVSAAFLRELAAAAGPGGRGGAVLDPAPPGPPHPAGRLAACLAPGALAPALPVLA